MTEPVIVEIPIPIEDVRYMQKLLRRERRRTQREAERSEFTPEPGHRDSNLVRIDHIDTLLALFNEYV
jgi:hypothetical protein